MTQEIVSQLKENGQDFEWYPTTVEMIETVSRKCASIYPGIGFSLLDIGAGDGRVLAMMDANHRRMTKSRRDFRVAHSRSDSREAAIRAQEREE